MAKKVKSSFINMVLTLAIITMVAAVALGAVYNMTLEPIAAAKKAARERAIKLVLPAFDSLESFKVAIPDIADVTAGNGGQDSLEFHKASKDGEVVGIAIATFSNKGYDAATQIQIMVGFLPDGIIDSTMVTQQKETPGLGTKMTQPKFNGQFAGKNPATFNLYVTKDKKNEGMVDAITASTISSSAVCEALRRAYQTFESYKKEGGPE